MDEKELQALYEAMGKKLGLPDFKSFRAQIESDGKFRKAFYDEASTELELGDFNSFDNRIKKKVGGEKPKDYVSVPQSTSPISYLPSSPFYSPTIKQVEALPAQKQKLIQPESIQDLKRQTAPVQDNVISGQQRQQEQKVAKSAIDEVQGIKDLPTKIEQYKKKKQEAVANSVVDDFDPKQFLEIDITGDGKEAYKKALGVTEGMNAAGIVPSKEFEDAASFKTYFGERLNQLNEKESILRNMLKGAQAKNQYESPTRGDIASMQRLPIDLQGIVREDTPQNEQEINDALNVLKEYKNNLYKMGDFYAKKLAKKAAPEGNNRQLAKAYGEIMNDEYSMELNRFEEKGIPIRDEDKLNQDLQGLEVRRDDLEERYSGKEKDDAYFQELYQIEQGQKDAIHKYPELKKQRVALLIAQELGDDAESLIAAASTGNENAIKKISEKTGIPKKDVLSISTGDLPSEGFLSNVGKSLYGSATGLLTGGIRFFGGAFGADPDRLTYINRGISESGNEIFGDNPYEHTVAPETIINKDLQVVKNPNAGKYNYNAATIKNFAGQAIGGLVGFVAGTKGLGYLGMGERAALWTNVIASGYENNYQKADEVLGKDASEKSKAQFALITGAIEAAAFEFLPKEKLGLKISKNEIKEFGDIVGKTAISKINKEALTKWTEKVLQGTLKSAGEAGKVTAAMNASKIVNGILRQQLGDKEGFDEAAGVLDPHRVGEEFFGLMLPLGLAEIPKAMKHSRQFKESLYDAATSPDIYRTQIKQAVELGRMTPEEGELRLKTVDALANISSTVPAINPETNTPLNHNQKVEYTYNRVKESAIQSAKEGVKGDEALVQLYSKNAKELVDERKAIIDGTHAEYKNTVELYDRIKEKGTHNKTLAAGTKTEGVKYLSEQALTTPNGVKNQLKGDAELTTDLIALNEPFKIKEELSDLKQKYKKLTDQEKYEEADELDRHITLLEEGLEKTKKKEPDFEIEESVVVTPPYSNSDVIEVGEAAEVQKAKDSGLAFEQPLKQPEPITIGEESIPVSESKGEDIVNTKGTIRLPAPYGSGKDFAELPKVLIRMGEPAKDANDRIIASSAYSGGKKGGQQEGVSVFEAGYDPRTGHIVINSGNEALTLSLQEAILQKRKIYLVEGKESKFRGEDFEVQIEPDTYIVKKEINPDDVVEDASSGDLSSAISGKELGENFPKYWTYENAEKKQSLSTKPEIKNEATQEPIKADDLLMQNWDKDVESTEFALMELQKKNPDIINDILSEFEGDYSIQSLAKQVVDARKEKFKKATDDEVRRIAKASSPKEVLDIIQKTVSDPNLKILAKVLIENIHKADFLKFKIGQPVDRYGYAVSDANGSYGGGIITVSDKPFYARTNNYISNGLDNGYKTILHEYTHAFTIDAYRKPKSNAEKEFKSYIDDVYSKLKRNSEFSDSYGFKSPEEFIAEVMTNPEFRLSAPIYKSGILDRIIEFIAKIFGYKKDKDLASDKRYEQIIEAYNYILKKIPEIRAGQGKSIFYEQSDALNRLSKAYHKAKLEGTNKELVKRIEQLFDKSFKKADEPVLTEEVLQTEGKTVEAGEEAGGGKEPPNKNKFLYEGSKEERKRGVLSHLLEAKGVPELYKKGLEKDGVTYKIANMEEAAVVAKSIIKDMGVEDALEMARGRILHPSVGSAIFGESINEIYKSEQSAIKKGDTEAALKYAKQWADISKEYAEEATGAGQFNAQIMHFYKQSPLGFVLKSNEQIAKKFEDYVKDKDTDLQEVFKMITETEGGKNLLTEKVEALRKEERKAERKKRDKKIDDFFDGLKASKDILYSAPIPPSVWNGAMDVLKIATKGGDRVVEAVQKAIEHITKNVGDDWDKERFRKEYEKKLSDIVDEGKSEKNYEQVLRDRADELRRRIKDGDFSSEEYKEKKQLSEKEMEAKKELEEVEKEYKEARKKSPEYIDKKAKQYLDMVRGRLKDMNEKQKEDFIRRVSKKIIENGGLRYEEFKKELADVMGFKELTPEQIARAEELTKDINGLDEIENKMVENPTEQSILDYVNASNKAIESQNELFNMVARKTDIMQTFKSWYVGSLLGVQSLFINTLFNPVQQLSVRFPKSVLLNLTERGAKAISMAMHKATGAPIYDPKLSVLDAQKGYFGSFKPAAKNAWFNFKKGTENRDLFGKNEYQTSLSPRLAAEELAKFKKGEIYLTPVEVIDRKIRSSIFARQADVILRGMQFGDVIPRWMAEGAKSIQVAKNELKITDPVELDAFMYSPEKMAKQILLKQGKSPELAAKLAAEIKERIVFEGQKAVMQEGNILKSLSAGADRGLVVSEKDELGMKLMKNVGSAAKTLTFPFIGIPANLAWQGFKLVNPEVSLAMAISQTAISMSKGKKGDMAASKKYMEMAKDNFAHSVLGLTYMYAASALVNAGLTRSSNDEETSIKERAGESVYGKQNQFDIGKAMGGESFWVDNKFMGLFGTMLDVKSKQKDAALKEKAKTGEEKEYDSMISEWANDFRERVGYSGIAQLNNLVFNNGSKMVSAINGGDAPFRNWVTQTTNGLSNMFTGGTYSAFSKAVLPEQTQAKGESMIDDIINSQKQKNVLLRLAIDKFGGNGMPPSKISIWGEPIKNDRSISGVLGSMLGWEKDKRDVFGAIIYDDYRRSGNTNFFPMPEDAKFSVNGKQVKLTPQQKQDLDVFVGQARKTFAKAIASDLTENADGEKYSQIKDDQKKIDFLSVAYELGKEIGYKNFIIKYPQFAKVEDFKKELEKEKRDMDAEEVKMKLERDYKNQ